jgi:hypothetical protein
MNDIYNWKLLNKFPLLNFSSGSLSFTAVNDSGFDENYSIKNIDSVILNELNEKKSIAQYIQPPNNLNWEQDNYLAIKLIPDEDLIRTINQTLYVIKGYETYCDDSGYYIRDYNLGQVSELLEIFPLVNSTGGFIDLSSIFYKLTDSARESLIKIYKEKIFVKFPLPQDIAIDWSKL